MLYNNLSYLGPVLYICILYLSAGDCTKLSELFPQLVVIYGVVQVLHVQIHSLVAIVVFYLEKLKLLLELFLPFGLFLGSADVKRMAVKLFAVHCTNCLQTINKQYSL